MHQLILSVKFYFQDAWVSSFKKILQSLMNANIWIKWPSNIIGIHIYAISGERIYLDICFKYISSEYIRIFVRYIIWHTNIFGLLFQSILWYSLITSVWMIYVLFLHISQKLHKKIPHTGDKAFLDRCG